MRPEYYLLIILLAAAVAGSFRMKGVPVEHSEEEKEARKREAKMKADLADWRRMDGNVIDFRYHLAKDLNAASRCLHSTRSKREAAEHCIRTVESALAEQDKLGFVTDGSEMNVLHATQHLNGYETEFIKAQQAVHAYVEKVRDHVFDLLAESVKISEWMPEVSARLQEQARKLVAEIEPEAKAMWAVTDRMLTDADRDPAGLADEYVTPGVTKWREERVGARRKIRDNLASKIGY